MIRRPTRFKIDGILVELFVDSPDRWELHATDPMEYGYMGQYDGSEFELFSFQNLCYATDALYQNAIDTANGS